MANSLNQDSSANEMSFADFMYMALYGPDGYYTNRVRIGTDSGDFYTAAQSRLFGMTLGNYVISCWKLFGEPDKLQIVELGAGQGELAKHVLNRLHSLLPERVGIYYCILDVSPHLQNIQKETLSSLTETSHRLHVEWSNPDRMSPTVVIGNEVLDALPVERVKKTPSGWKRLFVYRQEGVWSTVWKRAPESLQHLCNQWLNIPNQTEAEICVQTGDLFQRLRDWHAPLRCLLIDYGITKAEWESGARPCGTVRAYRRHALVDVLDAPGTADITADVNWDLVQAAARDNGWRTVGCMTQGAFLMQHGILDILSAFNQAESSSAGRVNERLVGEFKQLVLPGGMGERFSVLELAADPI